MLHQLETLKKINKIGYKKSMKNKQTSETDCFC